jgi:hypothetical protein
VARLRGMHAAVGIGRGPCHARSCGQASPRPRPRRPPPTGPWI